MNINKVSNSAGQTKTIGRLFAKILKPGDIVLLSGELGAGKTTFVSGIAEGLGYCKDTASPSFTILNIYTAGKKAALAHADLYRLESIDDIFNTGIEDYIYSGNIIVLIEWGDKIKDYLEKDYVDINFKYDLKDENMRRVNMKSDNAHWDKKLCRFKGFMEKCIF